MPVDPQPPLPNTPMGATLVPGGATFRTWAPCATDVYVVTDALATGTPPGWAPGPADRLFSLGDGTWAGYVPGVRAGTPYLFWVHGTGSSGFKRDPYARELGTDPPFPDCPCVVIDAGSYPWQARDWRPPAFNDLIIYQLHVGTYWAVDAQGHDRRRSHGTFLDVAERLPYLRDLGINAVQLLPIQEFPTRFSLGYNGVDYFSPEMDYQVQDHGELVRHLGIINGLLTGRGQSPLAINELVSGPNQLKCLVDLCHLHGLAVIFDVVYNHAGGDFGDRSLWFYDRQPDGDANHSLYFTNRCLAGGNVFAYWQAPVRQFLIDNARFFLEEYRIDGLRYDEVSVISNRGGDGFCRDLTSTVRYARPEAIQIAEYWNPNRAYAVTRAPDGLGFDAALADGLRDAVRQAISEAVGGAQAAVNLDAVRDKLYPPDGFPAAWTADQCLENHDLVHWKYDKMAPDKPRIPRLADPSNARSWYARSRSRVATTLLLTAPGIPMLFMGQEFLEDKPWSDDVDNWPQFLIWWDGLQTDRTMQDFLDFTRDLVWLRRARPALRGAGIRVSQVHNQDRVLVMHRWVEGLGQDIIVVASLNERTLWGYSIDLPWPGHWHEIFNSDYYDNFPNPGVVGNGGGVDTSGPGQHGYPYAAQVTIPANGAVILARDL